MSYQAHDVTLKVAPLQSKQMVIRQFIHSEMIIPLKDERAIGSCASKYAIVGPTSAEQGNSQTKKIRLHVCKEILLKPIHLKTNKDKNRKEATPRGTNSFPRPSDLSGVDFSDEAVDFESEETVLDPRSASGLLRHSGDQLAYGVLSSVSGIQCMRSAYSIAFS